jgi:Ca2+-binding EF-hand superfamily protein
MRWTLTLVSLCVALVAQAGTTAPPAKPGRYSIDANNDGIVTREEARSFPRLSEQFDAADTNKDGQLDTAEMNAHREAMRGEMRVKAQERWTAADKDGDGALSREEASASMPRMADRFDQFDANGDGTISRDEMHNFRMRQQRRAPVSE